MTDGHAVRWTAPEIMDMERPVTEASDVYSFAMVIVEAFTGRAPFYNSTPTTVIVDVLSGCRPERPTDPNLTDDLWILTEQCWDHNPQRRPRITEVVLHLRSGRGDRAFTDSTTLGAHRQKESFFTVPQKLRYILGFDRASAPRSPPGKGPAIDVKSASEREDQRMHEPLYDASNLPRKNGGWFSGHKSHSKSNRHDSPSPSRGKPEVQTGTCPSEAGNCSTALKRFLS